MDWSLIIGFAGAYFTIVFSVAALNIAMFSWMRSDMREFMGEIRSWKEEMNKETKDFHGRLCSIEEKIKDK